jgi:hypothetical protein
MPGYLSLIGYCNCKDDGIHLAKLAFSYYNTRIGFATGINALTYGNIIVFNVQM